MKINDIYKVNRSLKKGIWRGRRLNKEVAINLRAVAKDFFDSLGLGGTQFDDITFTGSLANFNYTKFSDIDLHILVDFKKIDADAELVREYFSAKSSNWNNKHDIRIFGHEIELYVQDSNEPHHSTGVYSVQNDQWLAEPKRKEPEVDEDMVKRKVKSFIDMIERVQDKYDSEKYEDAHHAAKKLVKKIKKFRQSGLEDKGEYSYENLTFKYLRNYDHIKELFDIRTQSYDKMKSVGMDYNKKFKIFVKNDELLDETGFDRLVETEKYQQRVKRRHKRAKKWFLGGGKQNPGSPFSKKPNYKRSKSAPAGFGGS
tara:strand:+ start:1116 stop:2057 length:942 start_codon:yes stop_codon:yes gene_type:complete